MRMIRWILFFSLIAAQSAAQSIYAVRNGNIKFYSDAPQELIKAYSGDLNGAVDFSKKTFIFRIGISSFEGFNSPLQREHFNENYMETNVFPLATFTGKIIESIDLSKNDSYRIRAKGKLKIHGIEQERIIPATVNVKDGKVFIHSDFTVWLADHKIKVPRVVNNKLSQEIHVEMSAELNAN